MENQIKTDLLDFCQMILDIYDLGPNTTEVQDKATELVEKWAEKQQKSLKNLLTNKAKFDKIIIQQDNKRKEKCYGTK